MNNDKLKKQIGDSDELLIFEKSLQESIEYIINAIPENYEVFKNSANSFASQISNISISEYKNVLKKYSSKIIEKNEQISNLIQDKNQLEEKLNYLEESYSNESKIKKQIEYENEELKRKLEATIDEKEKIQENLNKKNRDLYKKCSELEEKYLKMQIELQDQNYSSNQSFKTIDKMDLKESLKILQSVYIEFKESAEKLENQNENIIGTTVLGDFLKQINQNENNWINEIKNIIETEIDKIKVSFGNDLKIINEKLNQEHLSNMSFKIQLKDERVKNDNLNQIINELKNDCKRYKSTIESLNDTILTQKEAYNLVNSSSEKILIELNRYINDFKFLEEELDTIFLLFDFALVS